MATIILDEADVRRIAREEAVRPACVHQRSCELVIGLPRRDYLRAAHAGLFPWTKEGRLLIARTADVLGWLERRLVHRDVKPANDSTTETIALSRVGARRVG